MARQVVSRTQRRMEKKQALILLVLVLAVSLVSFTLGVMVGRSASPAAGAAPVEPAPVRLPVAQEAPPTAVDGPAEKTEEGNLTFYDTLPKGEQPPLGSGINLPPEEKPPAAAPAPPPPAPPEKAEPVSSGSYVVQVASFRQAGDARALQDRLAKKAYAAYAEAADLGTKGVWHRVYVGPFDSAETAAAVVERLKVEEKLSALAKKR